MQTRTCRNLTDLFAAAASFSLLRKWREHFIKKKKRKRGESRQHASAWYLSNVPAFPCHRSPFSERFYECTAKMCNFMLTAIRACKENAFKTKKKGINSAFGHSINRLNHKCMNDQRAKSASAVQFDNHQWQGGMYDHSITMETKHAICRWVCSFACGDEGGVWGTQHCPAQNNMAQYNMAQSNTTQHNNRGPYNTTKLLYNTAQICRCKHNAAQRNITKSWPRSDDTAQHNTQQ